MPSASNACPRCCALNIVTRTAPSPASTSSTKIAATAAKPRTDRARLRNVADVHFMVEPDRLVAACELEPHRHQPEALCHERVVGDLAAGDVLRQHGRSWKRRWLRELDRVAVGACQCSGTVTVCVHRSWIAG